MLDPGLVDEAALLALPRRDGHGGELRARETRNSRPQSLHTGLSHFGIVNRFNVNLLLFGPLSQEPQRLVRYGLAHSMVASIPIAARAVQVSPANQYTGVQARLDGARNAEHERAHRISRRGDAAGIHLGPLCEIRDCLPNI